MWSFLFLLKILHSFITISQVPTTTFLTNAVGAPGMANQISTMFTVTHFVCLLRHPGYVVFSGVIRAAAVAGKNNKLKDSKFLVITTRQISVGLS